MSLVEGIGDEVIEFFIGLLIVVIATIAWWSTRITDRPVIRTVLVFERRTQNHTSPSHTTIQASGTIHVTEHEPRNYVQDLPESAMSETQTEENKPSSAGSSPESSPMEGNSGDSEGVTVDNIPLTPEEEEQIEIVENMDSDASVLRRRRLDFFQNREDQNGETMNSEELSESDSNSTNINTETENSYHVESKENVASTEPDENDIRIKLKYINDDLKLVNGKLREPLGDFRRRHFEPELSSNKLVKLIFNGQVLQRDDVTLQGCGLFDNCVVHCLVHQKRSSPMDHGTTGANLGGDGPMPEMNRNRAHGLSASIQQGRDWDLGNLLFAIVSFVLGAAWYFRYEYAQLYTVTATIALVGLTGIFTVLLVGMYFPDPEPAVQPTQS